jgi:hypothetical protein
MFQAEYSSGQPLRMLVDLRAAIDDALGHTAAGMAKSPATPAKKPAAAGVMAARAGAAASAPSKFNVSSDETPEFEISTDEWNPDGPGGKAAK